MAALKILVAGECNGSLSALYKRVETTIEKAGPFEMLLCVGSFFAPGDKAANSEWLDYLSGAKEAPIQTYILGPVNDLQRDLFANAAKGGVLSEKIVFLGNAGIMTTASGLKIGYLSGVSPQLASMKGTVIHSVDHGKELLMAASVPNFNGVDVLLTHAWPLNLGKGSPSFPKDKEEASHLASIVVADVAAALRPRYHFAHGSVYYEREPYRNHVEGHPPQNVTRFLSIAPVANPAKEKWLYAFNVAPRSQLDNSLVTAQPPNTTDSPFLAPQPVLANNFFFSGESTMKRTREEGVPPPGYKCHKCHVGGHYIKDCPELARDRAAKAARQTPEGGGEGMYSRFGASSSEQPPRAPQPSGLPAPCWFCLASPQVEKHLIASVAKHMYVALPKGPLVPGHVMIVSVQHVASTCDLSDDAQFEVREYKRSLRNYYASVNKACVIFERNFRSQHLQLQVVPYDADIEDEVVVDAFVTHGEALKIDFDHVSSDAIPDLVDGNQPYFWVEFPGEKALLHHIKGKFPLQFGREVMASDTVLNVPQKVDWKACTGDKDSETAETKDFRAAFKPFDFSLKKKN